MHPGTGRNGSPLASGEVERRSISRQGLGCRCGFLEGNNIGATFAKFSTLEFYDTNFYPSAAKTSEFLRNIPPFGYLPGAAHTLRGKLHNCRAGLQHQGEERRQQRQPGHGIFQFHYSPARPFPDAAAPFPSTDRVNPNFVSVKPQVIAFRWV